jgi:osmotically-inducible protein OsmY
MKNKFILAALASVMAFGVLAGCSQGAQEEMDQAGDKLGQAGDKVGQSATDVGSAVAKDTEKVGEVADNAGVTGKVKTQLMTTEGVDASKINVDTVDNTVTLKGTVASEEAKSKAETAAKLAAGDTYTIDNQLTVGM